MRNNSIIERLQMLCGLDDGELDVIQEAVDEIERLRAAVQTQADEINRVCTMALEDKREIEKLRAALEPFARNVDAVSLIEALGHIEREHLHNARRGLEEKK